MTADGTNSIVQGAANSVMSNNLTDTQVVQGGQASGSGQSSVVGVADNSATIVKDIRVFLELLLFLQLDPTQAEVNARTLNAFVDTEAMINTLASLGMYQQVGETGASSIVSGSAAGDGTGRSRAQALADLLTMGTISREFTSARSILLAIVTEISSLDSLTVFTSLPWSSPLCFDSETKAVNESLFSNFQFLTKLFLNRQ